MKTFLSSHNSEMCPPSFPLILQSYVPLCQYIEITPSGLVTVRWACSTKHSSNTLGFLYTVVDSTKLNTFNLFDQYRKPFSLFSTPPATIMGRLLRMARFRKLFSFTLRTRSKTTVLYFTKYQQKNCKLFVHPNNNAQMYSKISKR